MAEVSSTPAPSTASCSLALANADASVSVTPLDHSPRSGMPKFLEAVAAVQLVPGSTATRPAAVDAPALVALGTATDSASPEAASEAFFSRRVVLSQSPERPVYRASAEPRPPARDGASETVPRSPRLPQSSWEIASESSPQRSVPHDTSRELSQEQRQRIAVSRAAALERKRSRERGEPLSQETAAEPLSSERSSNPPESPHEDLKSGREPERLGPEPGLKTARTSFLEPYALASQGACSALQKAALLSIVPAIDFSVKAKGDMPFSDLGPPPQSPPQRDFNREMLEGFNRLR